MYGYIATHEGCVHTAICRRVTIAHNQLIMYEGEFMTISCQVHSH